MSLPEPLHCLRITLFTNVIKIASLFKKEKFLLAGLSPCPYRNNVIIYLKYKTEFSRELSQK